MNNLIASVNLNSQDVEEGQLPDDGYHQPASLPPHRHPELSNLEQEYSSSSEIVLEVVEDQGYHDRKNKRTRRGNNSHKNYQSAFSKDKDKGYAEKQEKERKIQKNEKKTHAGFAPEKEENHAGSSNMKNTAYPPAPYYPPYMYPPHPMHMPMGQYPPMYPPYSYPMPYMHPNQGHYNGNMMSMPPYQMNANPQPGQNSIQSNNAPNPNSQYKQYMPPPPQYPDYPIERPNENAYKMPPTPMYPYPPPGYGYPMPYPPYDYYERQREAQQREEQIRASRKKEYIDQLRNELRRNVKQFNGDESFEILETVKCILKFQDAKPSNHLNSPQSNNTQAPLNSSEAIKEAISQRCYERSLQKVEKWLQGDNPNVREFMKGLLQAMQMSEVILKIKQLKLSRKMQQQSLQSQTKRLLDVLVRDPKKMIF